MKKQFTYQIILVIFLIVSGCREPFEIETQTFESLLVVESTITNEIKHQTIKLSRTYLLENNEANLEDNATVYIEDNQTNTYTFSQDETGEYISDDMFQAVENTTYTLYITTQDGRSYKSSETSLTPVTEITDLYAELITRDDGEEGVQVFVDTYNAAGDAQYFRYEYEETVQLVAPFYNDFEMLVSNFMIDNNPFDKVVCYDIQFSLREQEEETCYKTTNSAGILQVSTSNLSENQVSRFPVRFISKDSGQIRDRYSILVKQYTQTLEAYTYYETINELGSVESILSETQTGFLLGNMVSLNNTEEKVVGFFEVASIDEQRIFFDFSDFGLTKPDYLFECTLWELDFNDNSIADEDPNDREKIYSLLTIFEEFNFNYSIIGLPDGQLIDINPDADSCAERMQSFGPASIFILTSPECGDCTTVGSNLIPDFWED